jgi:polysaccharide pyruvyl transferase WcaK-like protein
VVRAPTSSGARHRGELIGAIVEAATAANLRGTRPVVLTMAGAIDRPFAQDLVQAMESAGIDTVGIEELGPTPAAALERLARLSGLITVRLHGLLLGALVGVPTVSIAYDRKVIAAAERLGVADLAVPLARVSEVPLIDLLEIAGGELRVRALRERVDSLRSERSTVAAAIMTLARRR